LTTEGAENPQERQVEAVEGGSTTTWIKKTSEEEGDEEEKDIRLTPQYVHKLPKKRHQHVKRKNKM